MPPAVNNDCFLIIFQIAISFGIAAGIRIGNYLGAGNSEGAKTVCRTVQVSNGKDSGRKSVHVLIAKIVFANSMSCCPVGFL